MTEAIAPSAGPDLEGGLGESDATRPRGVLIVDDWEPLRRIVCIWLRRSGFAVWAASDGREAAALYRDNRSAIDVVLLDVLMPDRDGPETLAVLRELDGCVRCCFMRGAGFSWRFAGRNQEPPVVGERVNDSTARPTEAAAQSVESPRLFDITSGAA